MGLASLVCTALYGTLKIIETELNALIETVSGIAERIESIARATMNMINKTVKLGCETAVKLVKIIEQQIIDALPGTGGVSNSIWCSRLFSCQALIELLMDKKGWLYQGLNKWFKRQCRQFVNEELWDMINDIISDFNTFTSTVCKYGMTFEFGMSFINDAINTVKVQMKEWNDYIDKQIIKARNLCDKYLKAIEDGGILELLDNLMSYFTCMLDGSSSCAEIATASNYYQDAMAKLKLSKQGDGYELNSTWKNKIYGNLEAWKNQTSNLYMKFDALSQHLVNGEDFTKANNAYNLAQLVDGMTMHTLFEKDGDSWGLKSWDKIKSGLWEDCSICQRYRIKKDKIKELWNNETGTYDLSAVTDINEVADKYKITSDTIFNVFLQTIKNKYGAAEYKTVTESWDIQTLMNALSIDSNGRYWVKYKCDIIELVMDFSGNDIVTINTDISINYNKTRDVTAATVKPYTSTEVIYTGDDIVSINEAAMMIVTDPESEFSSRCKSTASWLNGMSMNAGGAIRYQENVI